MPSLFQQSDSRPTLVGIVNVSPESFSDGGLVASAAESAERAVSMLDGGADLIEVGAASSHPDAPVIEPAREIDRLAPVLELLGDGLGRVGVDTWKPAVQRYAVERGAAFINDIQGFADPDSIEAVAAADCELVLMHSVQRKGQATRTGWNERDPVARIGEFFEDRMIRLEAGGVARQRITLDPGMGFFLGDTPGVSVEVLRSLGALRARCERPLLVCVSRKSFLGALTGRDAADRGPATLAAELFAAAAGVDAIRTHDPAGLADALRVTEALG